MDSWLSSLKDLLDIRNSAKLSLPGAICATLLVIIFWPPKPIDVIPVVQASSKDNNLQIGLPAEASAPPAGESWQSPLDGFIRRVLVPKTPNPACTIDEYYLKPVTGITGLLFKKYSDDAQRRQHALEEQSGNLERCLAAEKRLQGVEKAADEALQRDLTILEGSMAKQVVLLTAYEKADSPLTYLTRKRWEQSEKAIAERRSLIAQHEQEARDREWEIAELTRWMGIVSDRLAEPGRLRPELGFDDYLSALSKHVLAFIFLAVAVGMVLEGISTPGILGLQVWRRHFTG